MPGYPTITDFYQRALERKGGAVALASVLPVLRSRNQLAALGDDRYLAMMAKGLNQAGFHWQVIENKWPEFEDAFMGFDPARLALLPDEAWEGYMQDRRVVRNWQKIKAVRDNAIWLYTLASSHGSAANYFAHWPAHDQVGLCRAMKQQGARLGGMTGQMMLRRMGWDAYVLSRDVCVALQQAGLDIAQEMPASKGRLQAVQDWFTAMQQHSGLPYSHMSKILAYAVGENHDVQSILPYMHADVVN